MGLVGGLEISVETMRFDQFVAEVQLRHITLQLVHHVVFDQAFALPQTVVLEEQERTIAVSGVPVTFSGVSANAWRWVGWADIDRAVRVVVRTQGDVPVAAIETCSDWEVSDRPPSQRL